MRLLRQIGARSFLSLGLQVHRRRNPLRSVVGPHVKTVLDIGANIGQFAQHIRRICPDAFIYSFEPLPAVFEKLKFAARADERMCPLNLCLGDSHGLAEFFQNEFSASSSVLPITEHSGKVFPYIARTSKVEVPMTTLDKWAASRHFTPELLVKLDVQGFEDRVIKGGECTLRAAKYVICEVSFIPLYKGQPLFHDIYSHLKALGFSLAGFLDNIYEPTTDRIVQSDALFLAR